MAKQGKPPPGKRATKKSSPSSGPKKYSGAGSKRTVRKDSDQNSSAQRKVGAYPRPPQKPIQGNPERDLEADMDAREELLEGSLEQVFSVYEEALEDGVFLPVVFLVDCEDQLGGKLARDWVGREEVEEAIESNRASSNGNLTTTFAQCLSFQDCQDYVPKMFPYLQGTFQNAPPESTFISIVVARGGAGTFFVPYEAG